MATAFPVQTKETNRRFTIQQEGSRSGGTFTAYSGTPSNGTALVQSNRLTTQGGFNVYLDEIRILSSVNADIRLDIKGVNGLVDLSVSNEIHYVLANVPYTIKVDQELQWSASVFLTWIGATAGAPITVKSGWSGYLFSQSHNKYAEKTYLAIGDSITYGASSSLEENNPYKSWANLVYLDLFNKGIDIKLVNKGVPGVSASGMSIAVNCGWVDIDKVSLITIKLGTNTDSTVQIYSDSVKSIIDFCLKRFPKVPILVLNPITRMDATETVMVTYRAALNVLVNSYNNPLIKRITTEAAFDATNPIYGVISSDVHPNDLGHQMIANYVNNFITVNKIKI